MSAASRIRTIIAADDAMQEFCRMMEFAEIEPVSEPVVIESDPYLGDPVASLLDGEDDFAALIASYHEPRD